jgi:predicted esterase
MTTNYTVTEWNGKKVIIGKTIEDLNEPAELLIGFHGAESTPENMLIHGNKLKLPNTVMLFPEGPVDAQNNLWSWWLDGPKQKESVSSFIENVSSTIESAHEFLKNELNISSCNTNLWGFSQGAAAALVYASIGKHQISKIASVCGFFPEIPDSSNKNNPSNILGIFGTNDDIVPSFMAEYALDELKAGGHNVDAYEISQGHELTPENIDKITNFFTSK